MTRLVTSASGTRLGAAFGEIAAEGVIEAPGRRPRLDASAVGAGRVGDAAVAATHPELDRAAR